MLGCSSDDATPITDEPINEVPNEEPRLYKLGYDYGNVTKEQLTVKTKTGDGPWISYQFELSRISFHYGDSIHIIANHYIPNEINKVRLQVHNKFAYFDEQNYRFEIISNGNANLSYT